MNPKKTKSGKYHVSAYLGTVNGKKIFKSITADTRRECIMKATEYINNHPVDGSDLTVKQAVEMYIQSRENILSPSTIREYVRILNNDLKPLYNIRIDSLDNYTLQTFVNNMHLSPKTITNRYRFLISALSMHTDRRFRVTLPQPKEPARTVATEEDIKALLSSAKPELRKAILLGSCSLRRGEICALKYSDIQSDGVFVHADIVQDRDGNWIYKDHAKTPQSTRRVNISPKIISELGTGEGFVVDIPNPNALTQSFTALRDQLGINISLHSLRRFYASISHALGIPDKYIQKQGGWSTPDVMRKSYQQTLNNQEQEFSSIIADKMGSLIKEQAKKS